MNEIKDKIKWNKPQGVYCKTPVAVLSLTTVSYSMSNFLNIFILTRTIVLSKLTVPKMKLEASVIIEIKFFGLSCPTAWKNLI